MKEYIEKEKLFDCLDIKNALGGHYGISLTAINAIPAADVVEVVRCKNCKNRYLWLFCGYFGDEDYCPKGAKMDGGVNNG